MELVIAIGIPCGSTEISERDEDGNVHWRLERTSGCECLWCMLNSGDWKFSPNIYLL